MADSTPGGARTRNEIPQITAAAVTGDASAFRLLFEEYYGRVFRYALATGAGEAASHDIAQEVMLRLSRNLRVYPSDQRLWFWLARVARFVAIDFGRSQSRQQRVHASAEEPEDFEVGDGSDRLMDAIASSMEELPSPDREMVKKFYLEHGSVQQIADEFGLSYKSVESRLHRMRARLRELCLKKLAHE